jgi:putative YphP/YqiW family bacilliredoxin
LKQTLRRFTFYHFQRISIMAYDPLLVKPMREELTRIGVSEMLTVADVDSTVSQEGTTFIVINSVCGCAAGSARPAVAMAMKNGVLPDRVATVFAGQDTEATQHLRAKFLQNNGIIPRWQANCDDSSSSHRRQNARNYCRSNQRNV